MVRYVLYLYCHKCHTQTLETDSLSLYVAAEWGHPSDNLGAILSVAHYVQRSQNKSISLRDVLDAMIKAYEIQGVLALENSFNRVGLDHVLLVKVASTVVAAQLLGATRDQIFNALSN